MSPPTAVSPQQLLRVLHLGLRAMRLYPEAHPARRQAEERVLAAWGAVLEQGSGIVLDLVRAELLLAGELPERVPPELLQELVPSARVTGVLELRLQPRSDPEAVLAFLESVLRHAPRGTTTGVVPVARAATTTGAAVRASDTPRASDAIAVPTSGAGLPAAPVEVRRALQTLATLWVSIEQGHLDRHALADLLRVVAGRPGDGLSRPVTLVGGATQAHPVLEHALDLARVAALAARASGLTGPALDELVTAALCADIGMRSVPLDLLARPLRFTHEDFRVIRAHPVHGARLLLADAELPDLAGVVAFEHHLRRDGKGYPQTPHAWSPHPASLLVQAADVYTALRTPRPFRAALGEAEARQLLRKQSATALDRDALELVLTRAVPAGCAPFVAS